MRIGIYSPYLDTLGGGERYAFTVAQYFLNSGHRVEVFWDKPFDISALSKTFDLNLSELSFTKNIFASQSIFSKIKASLAYDLIFFISDGSIPITFAKKNILHFQTPLILMGQNNVRNKLKLKKFQHIVCNSEFTKKFIDRSFGIQSEVLYPPVDVEKFHPGKKENVILSVGRFSSPGASNSKKQKILINAFSCLIRNGLKNWKLILNGNTGPGSEIDELKKMREKLPIEISPDVSFAEVVNNYSRAKIYWHGAGFGEDIQSHPQRAEHFGITTVEAMASGAVPIVFSGGGQQEIINEGTNGLFWKTQKDLQEKTLSLINDSAKMKTLSQNAIQKSQQFSKQKFFEKISKWQDE